VTDPSINVLFLCTGNTARSVLAEAILRQDGAGRFTAFSAGSHPKGVVNPFALRVLAASGYSVDGLASKSWDVFAAPDAPRMDIVITVCDAAAGEACPLWPGAPLKAHWGIPDPAAVTGDDAVIKRAFMEALGFMKMRIEAFLQLPYPPAATPEYASMLNMIGKMSGASGP
jgi:protein-tyrosine-phosphatase